MIAASQLREGMALRIERQIYKVLESEFKAGAGQAGGRSRPNCAMLLAGACGSRISALTNVSKISILNVR